MMTEKVQLIPVFSITQECKLIANNTKMVESKKFSSNYFQFQLQDVNIDIKTPVTKCQICFNEVKMRLFPFVLTAVESNRHK